MAYRRFKLPETTSASATLTRFATVHPSEAKNVATVANVTGPEPKKRNRDYPQSVASVAAPEPDFAHWDEACWCAFYEERAAIAEFDGGLQRLEAEARAFKCCVVEWLNRTFKRSPPGRCLACGGGDRAQDPLLPQDIEPTGYVWLHSRCWPAWHAGRKAGAVAALKTMGIQDRSRER